MRNDFEPQDSNEEEYGSHKGVIVACGIVLVALLVGGGIIGIKNMTSNNDSNDSADISSSLAIRNDREFELGSKVVLSASTFTNSRAMSSEDIAKTSVDSDLMSNPSKYTYNTATKTVTDKGSQYLGVGKYNVKLTLNNDTKTVDFEVVDTVAPQFVNWSDKIYIKQVEKESDVDFSKYFTVQDYAKTTISIAPNKNEGTRRFDVTKPGEYYVVVTAKDASGNKTEKECVVDVLSVDTASNALLMTRTTDKILNNAEDIQKVEEDKKKAEDDEDQVEIPVVKPGDKTDTDTPVTPPTPVPEPAQPEVKPQAPTTQITTSEDTEKYKDDRGEIINGPYVYQGKPYFFADGVKQTGWQKISHQENKKDVVDYYLCDSSTGEMHTGWYTDGYGHRYWFGPEGDVNDCRMRTGTVVLDGVKYTFGNDGILQKQVSTNEENSTDGSKLGPDDAKEPGGSTSEAPGVSGSEEATDENVYKDEEGVPYQGFVQMEGNTYYFKDGIKQNGFVDLPSGNTYYLDPENGSALSTGEIKANGEWYLADMRGVIQKGVVFLTIKDSSGATTTHRYGYDSKDGHKLYGYQEVKSKKGNVYHYYFNETTGEATYGFMTRYSKNDKQVYLASSEKPKEGYSKDGIVYFNKTNGRQVESGWIELDGKSYYVQSGGLLATGKQTIEGTEYTFDDNGVKQ